MSCDDDGRLMEMEWFGDVFVGLEIVEIVEIVMKKKKGGAVGRHSWIEEYWMMLED